MIQNLCDLEKEEVEKLLNLKSTCVWEFDQFKREHYLIYHRNNKFEDWECKRAIDLNEIEVFDICEGKGQPYWLDFENLLESELFKKGKTLAKNLAIIKMTDLKYSDQDIGQIVGDTQIETISAPSSSFIGYNVLEKMIRHFINLGIESKRREILFRLLAFENNLKNASLITDLDMEEIEKIIDDNEIFKSETTVLDKDKIMVEIEVVLLEILIESVVITEMFDHQIEDYVEFSGFDNETITRIYELHKKFRPGLREFLDDCSFKLMERNFDYVDIEEICATNIFHSASDEYYYRKYEECLKEEYLEC